MSNRPTGLTKIRPGVWEVPQTGKMRVPGRIYASEKVMESQKADESVQQVRNVAHLPGIVKYSLAMPDFHWGYGFPIGGVAAFDPEEGVISPGGVGYDINCGVRIVRTGLRAEEVRARLEELTKAIFKAVPSGVGKGGAIPVPSGTDAKRLLTEGAKWAVGGGYGTNADLEHTEDRGTYPGADPSAVSDRAMKRGMKQIGTLGSGNHFLELQSVEEIFLPEVGDRLGIEKGSLVFSIHCGSRGFGYQVCDDFLKTMGKALGKYQIKLPDRQLACAPLTSPEARHYFDAMACAANYAWVNRQVIQSRTADAMRRVLGITERDLGIRLIYDVCHNIAKFEEHEVDGEQRRVCVHRKGATRAFAAGHPLVPEAYRDIGQPVLIPGDMGRASYILIGAEGAMKETFGSSCHGAGRQHSRGHMIRAMRGRNVFQEMKEKHGVLVMAQGHRSAAEEMPEAYKDVTDVVDVVQATGISKKVARLRPLAVVKG